MRNTLKAGTRVRFTDGRVGTVRYDTGFDQRTATVEFDDDKGVIVQRIKTDLTVIGEPEQQSALARMVEKLDNRPDGHTGYVTGRDELIEILKELSPLISVGIQETNSIFNSVMRGGNDVSVEIRLGFTLERDKL